MERTLKVVLSAGILSGYIAVLNSLFGWPRLSEKLFTAMMVFFIVALLGTAPFFLSSTSE
jgi:hypothetical protein